MKVPALKDVVPYGDHTDAGWRAARAVRERVVAQGKRLPTPSEPTVVRKERRKRLVKCKCKIRNKIPEASVTRCPLHGTVKY
jgi:hypothetical protein